MEHRELLPSLLPQGFLGDKGLHPQGTQRSSLTSIQPGSTGMCHPPWVWVEILPLTCPTWLFPRSNLPWISLQVFVSLCICRGDEGEFLVLL